jgi:4-diphosphocytidyl-2-C-methyl-D-erythritol kinase
MRSYRLTAPAKINLYLGIVGDRPDGFHELVMVMQSIDLADTVTVSETRSSEIHLTCDKPDVPVDETNLAWKAADLMRKRFPEAAAKHGGIAIDIQKRIPMGAGLAGGSADCAAVLVGIDLLWDLGLTQSELQEFAAEMGSDISFCVSGGTALCTGRGEVIDPLPDLDHIYAVLAKYRELPVPTPWAYKTYREQFGPSYPKTTEELTDRATQLKSGEMMTAIAHRDASTIGRLLHNDLERVVLPNYPTIQGLRDAFAKTKNLGTMMSGSGSTVFALCETKEAAEAVQAEMRSMIPAEDLEFWVTKFCASGVKLAGD